MKKNHLKHRMQHMEKRYIALLAIGSLIVLDLIFAPAYFNFRQHTAHIPWPDNNQIYHFNETAPTSKVYVALGDSLTYGFGTGSYKDSYTYQVASYLAGNGQGITLKDYSYPGFRTNDVVDKLDEVVASKPDIITILIGVNDTHQLVEAGDFDANYEKILGRLSSKTNAKIYVINIPYLGAPSVVLPPYNYYYDYRTRMHNDTLKTLAAEYNAGYIDLYGQTSDLFKKGGAHYSKDSYHPSAAGYKLWAQIIEHDLPR